MGKKSFVYLFLLMGIPVLILIFLHNFAENRFDVPVFYQVYEEGSVNCLDSAKFPYAVETDQLPFKLEENQLSLIQIPSSVVANKLQWVRLCDKLNTEHLKFYIIYTDMEPELNCGDLNQIAQDELQKLTECQLVVPDEIDLVLLDGAGRIRGYYNSSVREEIDRLNVEVDILVNNREYGTEY